MLKAYGLVNNNIKIITSFLLFFVFVFMGVGIETADAFYSNLKGLLHIVFLYFYKGHCFQGLVIFHVICYIILFWILIRVDWFEKTTKCKLKDIFPIIRDEFYKGKFNN